MTTLFSDFARWALAIEVPALNLPAIEDPSYLDLLARAEAVGFTGSWFEEGDRGLASILIRLGVIDSLEKNLCQQTN